MRTAGLPGRAWWGLLASAGAGVVIAAQAPGVTGTPARERATSRPIAPVAAAEGQAAPLRTEPVHTGPGPAAVPRIASYSIDVALDPSRRVLTGREVITWRNQSPKPTSEVRLHLYWNAWRDSESTFMRERRLAGEPDDTARRREDWAAIDVSAIRLLGLGGAPPIDLTAQRRHLAPDTGNAADRTVLAVPLPAPVAPGETINLAVEWTAHVPRPFDRTGRVGDYYFIAQWFPKVAVLGASGWQAHEFHSATEFFADYGTYDVRITVPAGWVVGATGRSSEPPVLRENTATHRFRQDDVHDFAWVTSPDLVERTARFSSGALPDVQLRLLLQPEHVAQAERHFDAARTALRAYGTWFGPYPYGHLTIVDPAWRSESGGVEYPTLITAGTRWLAPRAAGEPENVIIHEVGHQFFYGLVASNEVEHAWLDEGLNQYLNAKVMAEHYPSFHGERFFDGFIPWTYGDIPLARTDDEFWSAYRQAADRDAPDQPTWRYFPATGAVISYAKTALWMHTLERMVGWPVVQRMLRTYVERHGYQHPTPDDFFAVANEVSGRDLTWFFDEVHRSSNVFDYSVESLTSAPPAGLGRRDGGAPDRSRDAAAPPVYETGLVVRRLGTAVFPVEVQVTFADGSRRRERWNGRDRWRAFRFDTASPAISAVVDPDGVLQLDVNRTNNSLTLAPEGARAATKWTLPWLVWFEDRLLTFGVAF